MTLFDVLCQDESLRNMPALRCGQVSFTWSAFFQMVQAAEAGLWALGVRPGELVTILSLNTPEAVIAFYAIDRLGAVANWVDVKLAPAQVEAALTQAGSQVVLVLEQIFQKVYTHRGRAPAKHFVILPLEPYIPQALREKLHVGFWEKSKGSGCFPWKDLLCLGAGSHPEEDRWEETAAITYTGGTTGPAKGVMLSRRAFQASLDQYAQGGTMYGKGGLSLTLLPLFSAFGLCQCVHVPLCLGMTVLLAPLFRPGQLGELLREYRPDQVCGTTAYWQLLLEDAWASKADLSFLKTPRCGGDVLPGELEARLNDFLFKRGCKARIIKEYGMSEAAGIVCVSYGYWETGDAGRPLPGCKIVAVHSESGEVCSPGEQGELIISSKTMMNGYYRCPEADSQVLKPGPDGSLWVWTKDLGYTTADGRVVVTGRAKRMLSRNGFKIFPSEIENCLLKNRQVSACAVVGGKNRGGETVPVAHLVPALGADREVLETELRILAKEELNRFLIPEAYVFHESLPLTDRGKLDYLSLKKNN